MELTSWQCIILSFPFAALGFITFQEMTFEKILVVAIHSLLLTKTKIINKPINFYYEATKIIIQKDTKEALKHDKKLYKDLKSEQKNTKYLKKYKILFLLISSMKMVFCYWKKLY